MVESVLVVTRLPIITINFSREFVLPVSGVCDGGVGAGGGSTAAVLAVLHLAPPPPQQKNKKVEPTEKR